MRDIAKIKAVLFDFDDTLGDREKYAYLAYDEAVSDAAPGLSAFAHEAAVQHCLVLDQQGDTNKQYVRDKMLKMEGIDLGEHFNAWWEENLWKYAVLFPDALDTVKTLKERGYQTGIITNGSSYGQNRKLNQTGIRAWCDVCLVSEDAGVAKPDPRIYEMAAAKLGRTCEECAFVGDLWQKDLLGAEKAGMLPIWIWTHGERECRFDIMRIRHIGELLETFHGIDGSPC